MSIPSEILLNLWLAFLWFLGCVLYVAIRHLLRRERLVRGVK
jgi:hypothetical protein